MSDQMSDQEKAVIFATCGELEGILAGISQKHELKVIPAFLWFELLDTLKKLKERNHELEELAEVQTSNLEAYERVLGETKEAFSHVNPGQLIIGEQELIIPGVNGPRPEHMHLDRDTATGIMRGKQQSEQHKGRSGLTYSGPKHSPQSHGGKHKRRH